MKVLRGFLRCVFWERGWSQLTQTASALYLCWCLTLIFSDILLHITLEMSVWTLVGGRKGNWYLSQRRALWNLLHVSLLYLLTFGIVIFSSQVTSINASAYWVKNILNKLTVQWKFLKAIFINWAFIIFYLINLVVYIWSSEVLLLTF